MSVGLRVPTDEDAGVWADLFADPEVMRYVGTGEIRAPGWYRELVHRYGTSLAG